jgi:hypothetical protein
MKYLSLSLVENAADFIDKSSVFLSSALQGKKIDWKWVVICLDSAFYLYTLYACGYSNFFEVLQISDKKSRKEAKRALREGALDKANQIMERAFYKHKTISMSFYNALNKIRKIHSLTLNTEQLTAIKLFHTIFRNEIFHMHPTSWSIDTSEFPLLTLHVFEAIKLVLGKCPLYLEVGDTKITKTISTIESCLAVLKP